MVRVIGIDPGTRSFDFCGLEDGEVFLQTSITSVEVAENPQSILDIITEAGEIDLVAGPSGYGLPLLPAKDVGEKEFFQLVLVRHDDDKIPVLEAIKDMVRLVQKTDINMMFIPGVIHLHSVPVWRKHNRIDLGTADKLCCAILGVYDQARHLKLSFKEASFILVELGYGYPAAVGVKNGLVVDGVGGTIGGPGFLTLGGMDGELAYLLRGFSKGTLFQGGVLSLLKDSTLSPEDFADKLDQGDVKALEAWNAVAEGLVKAVASLNVSVPKPHEILLSGRLTRVPTLVENLESRMQQFGYPVRRVQRLGDKAKEAAQGAALFAEGLAGGPSDQLVKAMRLRECSGTVLDWISLPQAKQIRNMYREA
ncbi:MAG: DUF1464 family protein [Candidatus Hodarchaeota archaeon]